MRIITEPAETDQLPDGAALVLGFFDGVHLGHAALLNEAKRQSGITAVRMFGEMPKAGKRLTTTEEKLALLEEHGVSCVILDDFGSMKRMSGGEFFASCVRSLSPSSVICGYNFRFGRGASCGVEELKVFSAEAGIGFTAVPEFTLGGAAVSSTGIRALISEGRTVEAARLLGRRYSVTGEVVRGKQIGRTIDFPTVNQRIPDGKVSPAKGVYSCLVKIGGETYGGVCNIGSRPTVNENEDDVTLETYIFSFSGDLYGRRITVELVEHLRGEVRFASVAELKNAIENDRLSAQKSLASL